MKDTLTEADDAYHHITAVAGSHAAALNPDQRINLYARLMMHFQSRIASIELQQQREEEKANCKHTHFENAFGEHNAHCLDCDKYFNFQP